MTTPFNSFFAVLCLLHALTNNNVAHAKTSVGKALRIRNQHEYQNQPLIRGNNKSEQLKKDTDITTIDVNNIPEDASGDLSSPREISSSRKLQQMGCYYKFKYTFPPHTAREPNQEEIAGLLHMTNLFYTGSVGTMYKNDGAIINFVTFDKNTTAFNPDDETFYMTGNVSFAFDGDAFVPSDYVVLSQINEVDLSPYREYYLFMTPPLTSIFRFTRGFHAEFSDQSPFELSVVGSQPVPNSPVVDNQLPVVQTSPATPVVEELVEMTFQYKYFYTFLSDFGREPNSNDIDSLLSSTKKFYSDSISELHEDSKVASVTFQIDGTNYDPTLEQFVIVGSLNIVFDRPAVIPPNDLIFSEMNDLDLSRYLIHYLLSSQPSTNIFRFTEEVRVELDPEVRFPLFGKHTATLPSEISNVSSSVVPITSRPTGQEQMALQTSPPSAPPTAQPSAPPTASPTVPITKPPTGPPTEPPTGPPTEQPIAVLTSPPTTLVVRSPGNGLASSQKGVERVSLYYRAVYTIKEGFGRAPYDGELRNLMDVSSKFLLDSLTSIYNASRIESVPFFYDTSSYDVQRQEILVLGVFHIFFDKGYRVPSSTQVDSDLDRHLDLMAYILEYMFKLLPETSIFQKLTQVSVQFQENDPFRY